MVSLKDIKEEVISGEKEEEKETKKKSKKDKEEKESKEAKISDLPGIGPGTVQKLEDAGIYDLMGVAVLSPTDLSEMAGLGEAVARKRYQPRDDKNQAITRSPEKDRSGEGGHEGSRRTTKESLEIICGRNSIIRIIAGAKGACYNRRIPTSPTTNTKFTR